MVANTTKELADSIKKNLQKGYTEESLKWALIRQGYPRTTVELALKQAREELNQFEEKPNPVEPDPNKPLIKHEIYDEEDNLVRSYTHKKKHWWQKIFDFD